MHLSKLLMEQKCVRTLRLVNRPGSLNPVVARVVNMTGREG